MIQGLTFAIITTDDMPQARRFFTEQLGMATEAGANDLFTQFTTQEGPGLGITPGSPTRPTPEIAIYLLVDDVDAAHDTWRARGIEMVSAPHDEPFGRTFAFRNPEGLVMHAWRPAA